MGAFQIRDEFVRTFLWMRSVDRDTGRSALDLGSTGLGCIFLALGWAAGHNERSADDEMAAAFPYLIGTALLVSDGLLAIGYAVVKASI